MKTEIKIGRDAKTGKFVSKEFVKDHPETTVTQTIVKEKPEEKQKDEAN